MLQRSTRSTRVPPLARTMTEERRQDRPPSPLAWLMDVLVGHDHEFRKLWAGGLISTLGFHITALAMQLTAVTVLDASPLEMGVLAAAQFLPRFLFVLPAGAWVDRVSRRRVMIAGDLVRAFALATIPIAYVLAALQLPQLYLVAFIMGATTTFFDVAVVSFLPGLVGRQNLLPTNSRMQAGDAVAQIVGPGLAGTLVQLLTAPIAIALDSLSYVVSAVFITAIRRTDGAPSQTAAKTTFRGDIRAGMRAVAANPLLRAPIASGANFALFGPGVRSALVVLYLVELGVTPAELGMIYGFGGAAALAGAFVARPVASRLGLGRAMVGVHIAAAAFAAFVPLAGLVEAHRLWVLVAGQMGLSALGPIWAVNATSLQQTVTPDGLLARVSATVRFATSGAQPVGALLGGWAAASLGLQLTLTVAAGGLLLGAVILRTSAVANLRALPLEGGASRSRNGE